MHVRIWCWFLVCLSFLDQCATCQCLFAVSQCIAEQPLTNELFQVSSSNAINASYVWTHELLTFHDHSYYYHFQHAGVETHIVTCWNPRPMCRCLCRKELREWVWLVLVPCKENCGDAWHKSRSKATTLSSWDNDWCQFYCMLHACA